MLSVDYLPLIGGIANHIFHLASAMKKLDIEVRVVHPISGDRAKIERGENDGVTVYRVVYPTPRYKIPRVWTRTLAGIEGVERAAVDLGGIDVLHQHDHFSTTLTCRWLSRRYAWVWTNQTYRFSLGAAKPLHRPIIRCLYHGVRGIICCTPYQLGMTRLVWKDELPSVVIPNGVNTERFHPRLIPDRSRHGLDSDDFVVMCPSRMTEQKGLVFLAEAINILLRQKPEVKWRFLFAGSDPASNTDPRYINHVKKLLEPAQEDGFVRYLGNINMAKMPEVTALADVVVIPSLWESFGIAGAEALAAGKPLVATPVGAFPEMVQDGITGLLVPPSDTAALAKALLRLQQDSALRLNMVGAGCRQVTELYNWDTIARRTIEFYKQVRG